MSVERARVIKANAQGSAGPRAGTGTGTGVNASANTSANATRLRDETFARRVPAIVVDAHEEATQIVAAARAKADAIVAEAKASVAAVVESAAREAREQELARVAAELISLRVDEEQRAERQLDRTVEIAVLLAERLVGDAIAVEPARVVALAQGALLETRGARQMRIEACREDVAALEAMLASLGEGIATIEASDELARGSLVVHTELGRIDARLAPQLTRLATALREALRGDPAGPEGASHASTRIEGGKRSSRE